MRLRYQWGDFEDHTFEWNYSFVRQGTLDRSRRRGWGIDKASNQWLDHALSNVLTMS